MRNVFTMRDSYESGRVESGQPVPVSIPALHLSKGPQTIIFLLNSQTVLKLFIKTKGKKKNPAAHPTQIYTCWHWINKHHLKNIRTIPSDKAHSAFSYFSHSRVLFSYQKNFSKFLKLLPICKLSNSLNSL